MSTPEQMLKCDCPKWWDLAKNSQHHASCNQFVYEEKEPITPERIWLHPRAAYQIEPNKYSDYDQVQGTYYVPESALATARREAFKEAANIATDFGTAAYKERQKKTSKSHRDLIVAQDTADNIAKAIAAAAKERD